MEPRLLKIRFSAELVLETTVEEKVNVVTEGEIAWLEVIPAPLRVAVRLTGVDDPA